MDNFTLSKPLIIKKKDVTCVPEEDFHNMHGTLKLQPAELNAESQKGCTHNDHGDHTEESTNTMNAAIYNDHYGVLQKIHQGLCLLKIPTVITLEIPFNSMLKIHFLHGYSPMSSRKNSFTVDTPGVHEVETCLTLPMTSRLLLKSCRPSLAPVEGGATHEKQGGATTSQKDESTEASGKSQDPNLATFPKASSSSKADAASKCSTTLVNKLSDTPKDTSNRDQKTRQSLSHNLRDGPKPSSSSVQFRKVPWKLFSWDKVSDQSKPGSNSVLGTRSKQHFQRSRSKEIKSEHGLQTKVKMNRAFDLRLSKLETDRAKQRREETNGNKKGMGNSKKHSVDKATLHEYGAKVQSQFTIENAKALVSESTDLITGSNCSACGSKNEIKSGGRHIGSIPGKGVANGITESKSSSGGEDGTSIRNITKSSIPDDGMGLYPFTSCIVMNDNKRLLPILLSCNTENFQCWNTFGSPTVSVPTIDDYQNGKDCFEKLTTLGCRYMSTMHHVSTRMLPDGNQLHAKCESHQNGKYFWMNNAIVFGSPPLPACPEYCVIARKTCSFEDINERRHQQSSVTTTMHHLPMRIWSSEKERQKKSKKSQSDWFLTEIMFPIPFLPGHSVGCETASNIQSLQCCIVSEAGNAQGPPIDDYRRKNHSRAELTILSSCAPSTIPRLSTMFWSDSRRRLEEERESGPKGNDGSHMSGEVVPKSPLVGYPKNDKYAALLPTVQKSMDRVESGIKLLDVCLIQSYN